jgi:hypothetical protein
MEILFLHMFYLLVLVLLLYLNCLLFLIIPKRNDLRSHILKYGGKVLLVRIPHRR